MDRAVKDGSEKMKQHKRNKQVNSEIFFVDKPIPAQKSSHSCE
jgi:hypothetical protein